MVSIITIYIKEKRTHAAERTLSLPACPPPTALRAISTSWFHPAALCGKPHPEQILAWMPYFTTTVNTSSIMGTKFYFLLVLPLSADDIIPVAVLPMRAAAGNPGGCSPCCTARPAQPRVGGKPDLLPHPGFWGIPPLLSAFIFLFILTHASLQPQLPAAQGCTFFIYHLFNDKSQN